MSGAYFETEEIFVAWYLKYHKQPNINKFSLKADGLRGLSADKVYLFEKHNQHNGWGSETVYVFKSAMIDTFLKQYVLVDIK